MKTIENVVVLIADGVADSQGDAFHPDEIHWEYVRVSDSFSISKPVGRATLRKEGNRIVATLEVIDDFPTVGLYPCIGGHRRNGIVEIFEIGLTKERNADSRIPMLESPHHD